MLKRSNNQSQLYEEEFRLAFEDAVDAIFWADIKTGLIINCNKAAESLLEKKREEIIGQPQATLHPPQKSEYYSEMFKNHIAQSGAVNDEAEVITKSGKIKPVHITASVTSIGEKQIIQGIFQDITELKRAKEILEDSEKKYRDLVDNALIGIYKTNLKGNILYVNNALAKMFEFDSPEEMMSNNVLTRYKNPEDRDILIENLKKKGKVNNYETEVVTKTGKTQNILLSATLEGDVLSGMIMDITNRKQAEEELKAIKKLNEEIIEKSPIGIHVVDRDFIVRVWNSYFEGYTKIRKKDIIGKNLFEVIPELTRDEWDRKYKDVMKTGVPFENANYKYIRSVGPNKEEVLYQNSRIIPIKQNGDIVGAITILEDITEQKLAEEKIQAQIKRFNVLRFMDMTITASLDLNITLDILLIQITTQLGINAVSVLLLNKHTQMLEYVASKGFRSNALKYTKLKLGESNAGRAALEQRIITIPNLKGEPDGFVRSEMFVNEDFIVYIAVPLIAKGEVKGVLELFQRSPLSLDPDWLEFIGNIGDQAAIAIDNATLFDDLSLAYDTTIEGWSRALDLRDKETEGHSQRVTDMTLQIAREMGIKEEELVHIKRGALLHDIGKMGVPDDILLKPGPLTDEEWEIMKRHTEYAYNLLYPIEYLRPALDIPYYHHEKWDGTGYPRGLKGEEIPLAARIFALLDVWDALSSDRPYRPAWQKEKVMEYIRSQAGIHFDPKIVEAFLKMGL